MTALDSGTAISRAVLSDTIKDRLLAAILDGRYPPGSRIVETRLARQFGTSQAPVREALRELEALGVVEITAFRGARVRRPPSDMLLEVFTVRCELEALAVRLALPRLSAADIDYLASRVAEMRRASAAGDTVAEASADAAFHHHLVAQSGNATLLRVWERLQPFSRTYISLAIPGADQERIIGLHSGVLAAVQAGDAAEAELAIRHHFSDTGRMLVARLAARPDASSGDALPSGSPDTLTP